mmetsp:Transcript_76644/g.135230  ORF Transcript_76644/g.135230 Transcript_76644/m.135230 type:complete len:128 (-) Transcript_76644:96-479(-)
MQKLRILPLLLLAALARVSISKAFLSMAEAPKTMLARAAPGVVGSLMAAAPELALAKEAAIDLAPKAGGEGGLINLIVLGVGIVALIAVIVLPQVVFSSRAQAEQEEMQNEQASSKKPEPGSSSIDI